MTGTVRLAKIGDVTALGGFEDGEWWAQDIAASLPVKALSEGFDVSGKRVLDMCAAPGGKTLQLAAMGAQVTALDISESRLTRLHENLARTKLSAEVAVGDGRKWQRAKNEDGDTAAQFDAVLLDAPCSATGTYRRHPDVLFNKQHTDIGKLASLQDKLLPHYLGTEGGMDGFFIARLTRNAS